MEAKVGRNYHVWRGLAGLHLPSVGGIAHEPTSTGSGKRWSLEAYRVGLETKQNLASRSGAAASSSAGKLGLEGRRSELPWP